MSILMEIVSYSKYVLCVTIIPIIGIGVLAGAHGYAFERMRTPLQSFKVRYLLELYLSYVMFIFICEFGSEVLISSFTTVSWLTEDDFIRVIPPILYISVRGVSYLISQETAKDLLLAILFVMIIASSASIIFWAIGVTPPLPLPLLKTLRGSTILQTLILGLPILFVGELVMIKISKLRHQNAQKK